MTAKNPKKSKIKMAVVTPSIRVFWGCLNQYGNVYIYIYPDICICRACLDLAALKVIGTMGAIQSLGVNFSQTPSPDRQVVPPANKSLRPRGSLPAGLPDGGGSRGVSRSAGDYAGQRSY